VCLWLHAARGHTSHTDISGISLGPTNQVQIPLYVKRFCISVALRLGCSEASYSVIYSVRCRWGTAKPRQRQCCYLQDNILSVYAGWFNDYRIHPTVAAICLNLIDLTTVLNICPNCHFHVTMCALARKCHHKNMGFCI
jgi:hypothetical protein